MNNAQLKYLKKRKAEPTQAHPMLFNGDMVRAILDGRKTQTRRVIKNPAAIADGRRLVDTILGPRYHEHLLPIRAEVGDLIWVRETWRKWSEHDFNGCGCSDHCSCLSTPSNRACYKADGPEISCEDREYGIKWVPSIHMPRWASRLTLEITGIRVERLQDINRGDAMSEGCPFSNMADGPNPVHWFSDLWNGAYGPTAWGENPWVAAYTFKTHHANVDQVLGEMA